MPAACVRFLRRRSPAGLRYLVCNLVMLLFFALRSVLSACARQGEALPLSACFACSQNARRQLVKTAYHFPLLWL